MDTDTGTPPIPAPDNVQASSNLDELQVAVSVCSKCALSETRTQTVFGVGNPNASVMIIGEAPGADEDRLGEPFVGRAYRPFNEVAALTLCHRG